MPIIRNHAPVNLRRWRLAVVAFAVSVIGVLIWLTTPDVGGELSGVAGAVLAVAGLVAGLLSLRAGATARDPDQALEDLARLVTGQWEPCTRTRWRCAGRRRDGRSPEPRGDHRHGRGRGQTDPAEAARRGRRPGEGAVRAAGAPARGAGRAGFRQDERRRPAHAPPARPARTRRPGAGAVPAGVVESQEAGPGHVDGAPDLGRPPGLPPTWEARRTRTPRPRTGPACAGRPGRGRAEGRRRTGHRARGRPGQAVGAHLPCRRLRGDHPRERRPGRTRRRGRTAAALSQRGEAPEPTTSA